MNKPPSGEDEAKTRGFQSSNTRITTGLKIKPPTAAELKRAARKSQASPYPKTPPKTKRFTAQPSPSLNVEDFELPPSPIAGLENEISGDFSLSFANFSTTVAPAAETAEKPPAPAP